MFERELMISGLRRQHSLLLNLIEELEKRPGLDLRDQELYDRKTKEVAHNLRKLRKIKDQYFAIYTDFT